jgi:ribosomal protein L16 Arg81 hydroxylase
MPKDMSLLRNLLRPVSVRKFLSDHREKGTLFIRRNGASKFRELLSMEKMDQIISSGYLRHPECKLAKDGREIPLSRYAAADISSGAIDTDALYSEYSKGATVIVNSAHRYWRPLSNFCRGLERLLSVPVQANIYLTPKGSQGFAAHYDPHDVFILQISGRKRWRLYGSPVILPDERQLFNSTVTPVGRIRQSCTLRAGDLLYIPRGHLHDATSADEASLHITVGIRGITWGDLLLEAVDILVRSDATLRTSLPAGFADRVSATAAVQRKLLRLRSKVASDLPMAEALDEIADRFVSRRHQFLEGQLVDLERDFRLGLESTVARRPEVLFRMWRQRNKICMLFFRKKIMFPAFAGPALRFVAAAGSFRPREIPGGLTNRSKLVLCRRLVSEGFLRIAAE